MADRYFVGHPIESGGIRVTGADAHHLAHVLRAKPGDVVTLFDGSGREAQARIERVGRADVELVVLSHTAVDREALIAVTLAVALPKGDRPRWLVEKAVELGVASLTILETARSNRRDASASIERLHRAVIEASKQCGRNRLMHVDGPCELAGFLAGDATGAPRLIALPGAQALSGVLDELAGGPVPPRRIQLAIGPEGGFATGELALAAQHGWRPVGLGPRVLRVETAALALAAAVLLRLG